MPAPIQITVADLANPEHQKAVVELLDMYHQDAMANAAPLPATVASRLITGLREHPTSLVLLAFRQRDPVGICVCFEVYSTFQASPILNIHDIAVHPHFRKQGIGKKLLEAAEQQARETGCCKITLEVREDNDAARRLYQRSGFGDSIPPMHFWHKPLNG